MSNVIEFLEQRGRTPVWSENVDADRAADAAPASLYSASGKCGLSVSDLDALSRLLGARVGMSMLVATPDDQDDAGEEPMRHDGDEPEPNETPRPDG